MPKSQKPIGLFASLAVLLGIQCSKRGQPLTCDGVNSAVDCWVWLIPFLVDDLPMNHSRDPFIRLRRIPRAFRRSIPSRTMPKHPIGVEGMSYATARFRTQTETGNTGLPVVLHSHKTPPLYMRNGVLIISPYHPRGLRVS